MSNMLETYSIAFKGKKGKENNYKLKFKVVNGVKATYNEVDNINEVYLRYDSTVQNENFEKDYKITGKLNIQFVQYPKPGSGKGDETGDDPVKKPIIIIDEEG